jgi:hypothetical protein
VALEGGHEGRRDGLFAFEPELLPQQRRGPAAVEVAEAEVEGALAAGAGLEVEPDQQQVEVRVLARGAHGVERFGQFGVVQRSAAARSAAGLVQLSGRVLGEQPGPFGRRCCARRTASASTASQSSASSESMGRSPKRATAARQ